jgi:hypothetical protein
VRPQHRTAVLEYNPPGKGERGKRGGEKREERRKGKRGAPRRVRGMRNGSENSDPCEELV